MMPWKIVEGDGRCPPSKPWAVVKKAGNELKGCHATKGKAQGQLAALNVAESNSGEVMAASRAEVPRENLERSVPFEIVRAEENGDGLTLEGYAAVFDSPTLIDSWEGTFNERVRRGAFRKTIRERTPVIQFDHGRHPLIGSIPIGKIQDLREDNRGLFVSARLSNNWLIEPVRAAIADRAVDGMSFRFTVLRDEWRDKAGKLIKPEELPTLLWDAGERGPLERTLVEVKVPELGPVVFPAYQDTDVDVRARSVATTITEDDELRRQVRRSLAVTEETPEPDLSDPEFRREVARALLFGDVPDAPPDGHLQGDRSEDAPPDGHPSDPEPRQAAGLSHGAPPAGHPPQSDAPPVDGHPSPPDNTESERIRSDIREITGLMGGVLASIDKE